MTAHSPNVYDCEYKIIKCFGEMKVALVRQEFAKIGGEWKGRTPK